MASGKPSQFGPMSIHLQPSLHRVLHKMAHKNTLSVSNLVRLSVDYFVMGKSDGQILAIFSRPDDVEDTQDEGKEIRTTINLTPGEREEVRAFAKKYHLDSSKVIRLAAMAMVRGMTKKEYLSDLRRYS